MPTHVDPDRYPKAKYHHSMPNVLVNNPDEEEALGPEWVDHPDQVGVVVAQETIAEVKEEVVVPEPPKRGPGRPRKEEE